MYQVVKSLGLMAVCCRVCFVAVCSLGIESGFILQAAGETPNSRPTTKSPSASKEGKVEGQATSPACELQVGKILFLGNSITLHGPAPAIGWEGNWGMAASTQEKDYVHLLLAQIAKSADGKPTAMVKNIADFERRLDGFNVNEGLKQELEYEADLIVIAIGENVPELSTDEAKAKFRTAFDGLLTELKQHGRPTLFVRSSFWANPTKDEIMKNACENAKGVFVDIGKLGSDEANYARSERKLEHAGVAGHPGDKGMLAIADKLWSAIKNEPSLQKPKRE